MISDGIGVDGLRENAVRAARRHLGRAPAMWAAAPGRVNLIGEHTDYNDGYVLPAAIDRHVVIGYSPRDDRLVRLHALDLADTITFDLDRLTRDEQSRWGNYPRGVAWALEGDGLRLRGMDAVITSDVPVASGLSSSAAIEVATAYALQTASGIELDGVRRALLCQKAENQFVGMNCGIMDQYIVSLGKRDHALLIDCRSLEYSPAAIPAGCSLVICNSRKRRGLVDSEYNTRRLECERGARAFGVPALRDVSPEQFDARAADLDPVTRQRCRHVVYENRRTLEAVEAMRAGDLPRLGQLMNESHISLRDDYAVSCAELDALVEAAWRQPGTIGARMTGAGFGGCTVNLVRQGTAEAFARNVSQAYRRATGNLPEIYVCRAEDGVRPLD